MMTSLLAVFSLFDIFESDERMIFESEQMLEFFRVGDKKRLLLIENTYQRSKK